MELRSRRRIHIGTAGWSIPRGSAVRFTGDGTHLQRYARALTCAEINSSFHRPHATETYVKWRDSTPPEFRFAVKMPRLITHDRKLRDPGEPLAAFLEQSSGLGEKRGPILVQLPPSLAFDRELVDTFLKQLRDGYAGAVVCEPRHATWFTPAVNDFLRSYEVSRVAADPPPVPVAMTPGGDTRIGYFRLHGSPRTYWSKYDGGFVASLATTLLAARDQEVWCIFDNTASGAALENAWELRALLAPQVNQ